MNIDKSSSKPYYEQLVFSIKEEILQGILTPGERLPSVRELAKELLMNPNTISKAYKVLEEQQVLVTVKGKGTFVKAVEEMPRDEFRISQLKDTFAQFVVEAIHLQISEKEIQKWLQESYQKLGGQSL